MYQGAVERAGRVGTPGSALSFVNVASILLVAQVAVVGGIWWYFREVMNGLDSFVTAELRSIRAHFEGIAASYLEHSRVVPMFQTATA